MEGPFDPQQPAPDAGAPQAAGHDDDLHALLERLLGQGDVRGAAAGTDDLWPDLFPAAAPDDVSTIVPAPEAPAAIADTPIPTDVDDIHAAILASVSLELEPVAPGVAEAAEAPAVAEPATTVGLPAVEEPALPVSADLLLADALAGEAVVHFEPVEEPTEPLATEVVEAASGAEVVTHLFDAAPEPMASEPFALTPFEAVAEATTTDFDTDALWAAAVPELGLDAVPRLDLDADGEADDEPPASTAVVLPWPTQEAKAAEPAAPRDLIEAALSNVAADLTTEPVEPLRTPEVAAATAHVVFRLGTRVMAVPLAAVSEIARPPKYTRLPHVPAWVLGIANLRGDIVSILDLEGFFSGKVGRASHEQRMLALRPNGDEVRTAVLVDSVDGIQAFEDTRIARVTRGYDAEVSQYARGLYQTENELVVVLDADRLLQSKPMRQFEDGAGAR